MVNQGSNTQIWKNETQHFFPLEKHISPACESGSPSGTFPCSEHSLKHIFDKSLNSFLKIDWQTVRSVAIQGYLSGGSNTPI